MKKKVIVLLWAVILCCTLAAGCGKKNTLADGTSATILAEAGVTIVHVIIVKRLVASIKSSTTTYSLLTKETARFALFT